MKDMAGGGAGHPPGGPRDGMEPPAVSGRAGAADGPGGRPERDGVLGALRALRRIRRPLAIEGRNALDPDHLADLLLDFAQEFEEHELLELLTALQVERLDQMARELCLKEHLLLDPRALAEQTIVDLYVDCRAGGRSVPFCDFVREVMRRVAARAVDCPEIAAFAGEHEADGAPDRLAVLLLTETVNKLDPEVRRLVYLSWVRRLEIPEIAQETGVPAERVEWLLVMVVDRVRRRLRDLVERDLPGWLAGPEETP